MLIGSLILFISNPKSYLFLIPIMLRKKQQKEIEKQEAERSGN